MSLPSSDHSPVTIAISSITWLRRCSDASPSQCDASFYTRQSLNASPPPFAMRLIGASDSRAVLAQLERQNLFLVPLDSTRQWYRYHRLFADVLQAHLQDEWPQELEALHQRASEWFDANNMRPEAIRHALAAENHKRAADLIELAWPEMDRSFRPALWLTWVRALPESLLSDRPVLGVDYAWALLDTGDFDAGMTRLESAVNSLARPDYVVIDHDHFRSLPASIAMARSYYAQVQGDHVTTIEQAKQALEVLPEDDLVRRGVIDALQALAYWSTGELELAYEALEDGTANFREGWQHPVRHQRRLHPCRHSYSPGPSARRHRSV